MSQLGNGLARSVRSEETEHLTGPDRQIEAADGHRRPVSLGQPFASNDVHGPERRGTTAGTPVGA